MKLELSSGRRIALTDLKQSLTYHGLLAGLPTRASNVRRMAGDLKHAEKMGPPEIRPVLIPPVLAPTGRKVRGTDEPEERLPTVTCMATFESGPLERDDSEPYSSTVVVWYQEAFGLPDEVALEHIRQIDWEAVAQNWCW